MAISTDSLSSIMRVPLKESLTAACGRHPGLSLGAVLAGRGSARGWVAEHLRDPSTRGHVSAERWKMKFSSSLGSSASSAPGSLPSRRIDRQSI